MARGNFLPIVLTVGLIGIGGAAFYFASKKEGEGGGPSLPSLNLDEIIAWFNNLIKLPPPAGDGDGNGDGNGDGDGTPPPTTKPPTTKPPSTTPPTTSTGSTVLGAAGDWGSGRNSNWKKVTAVMKTRKIKLALGLGDYSYTNTKDWMVVVNDLEKAGIKMKGAEGNHDSSSYANTFNQGSMLTAVDSGPARIIIINTEGSVSTNVSFVEKECKATKKAWKIVITHKPPYTNDSDHGGEKSLASALKPIINKYGIAVVMAAHNHNYQRIVKPDMPKCVFIVSGTGGESHYSLKASESGTKKMDDSNYGFTMLTINGNTLKGEFISTGNKVLDSWTQSLGATSNYVYAYQAMEARISA